MYNEGALTQTSTSKELRSKCSLLHCRHESRQGLFSDTAEAIIKTLQSEYQASTLNQHMGQKKFKNTSAIDAKAVSSV